MSRHPTRRTALQLGAAASAAVVFTGPRASAAAQGRGKGAPPAPTGLLTDLLPQALGTTAGQRPRFSWQVPDLGPRTRQRAYQLEVATTPAGFKNHRLVWSSGPVRGLNHAVLWVRDADASTRFYTETLGLRVVVESGEAPRKAIFSPGTGIRQ
ncbi:Glyoxalase/Bleomycin resistance protein/Dioxygenase superfamily protein [Streptomyces sp. S4.7]|uniref:glycoside hydrolase family 78 protein n=1 Tax=Streptomyces sp. S4.7 TaxID=2705439 RepID=UPI001398FB22|nr:Glyoxalase/Bleomycin resistance protein/Dioxygenase superfamily protein [Streptomyces sp. S4.7]